MASFASTPCNPCFAVTRVQAAASSRTFADEVDAQMRHLVAVGAYEPTAAYPAEASGDTPSPALPVPAAPAEAADGDGLITLRARRRLVAQRVAEERALARQQQDALVGGLESLTRELPRGSLLPEHVHALWILPTWLQLVPRSHDLVWGGGLVGCRRCGSCTPLLDPRALLRKDCRGFIPAGSRRRIVRLLRGELPPDFKDWPDGGRDASDTAVVVQLGFGGAPPAWRLASA